MRPYLLLARSTGWLMLAYVRAAWYFRWQALPSLGLPNGLQLNQWEKKRFKHYFYGTTYLAALMDCLRRQSRSKAEHARFTHLSALAFCFDDLVDILPPDQSSEMPSPANPEAFGASADQRGIALPLLQKLYSMLPAQQLDAFKQYMQRVFKVEMEGRLQRQKSKNGQEYAFGLAELSARTAEKGGASVLLFRSVLSPSMTPAEEDALFQFGHLIQLSDDIFDLWHDRQAGIETLATWLAEKNELKQLSEIFELQVQQTKQAFRNTSYPPGQVETALGILHYLVGITRVCLNHYQGFSGLSLDNRTAIVVDMEKWPNRFAAIGQLLYVPL